MKLETSTQQSGPPDRRNNWLPVTRSVRRRRTGSMRMRLLFYAVLILAFFVTRPVFAQSDINNSHQKTSTPPDARYDVIQSQLAAKWTFRLDRFTGRVWQLVKTQNDENTWDFLTRYRDKSVLWSDFLIPSEKRCGMFCQCRISQKTLLSGERKDRHRRRCPGSSRCGKIVG